MACVWKAGQGQPVRETTMPPLIVKGLLHQKKDDRLWDLENRPPWVANLNLKFTIKKLMEI